MSEQDQAGQGQDAAQQVPSTPSGAPKRDPNALTSKEHEAIDGALKKALMDAGVAEETIADDLVIGPDEANKAFHAAADALGVTLSGKDGTENVDVRILRSALQGYYAAQKDAPAS